MSYASRNSQDATDDDLLAIETASPDEWIVTAPAGGRALHVYRLADGDWLVSEVGRGSEGRGPDLSAALIALRAGAPAPDWWGSIPSVIGEANDSTR
jgi:hypothetical protein